MPSRRSTAAFGISTSVMARSTRAQAMIRPPCSGSSRPRCWPSPRTRTHRRPTASLINDQDTPDSVPPRVRLRSEESNGQVAVVESTTPAPSGPAPSRFDETFYVLEGEFTVQLGNELTVAEPGELAFAPRGVSALRVREAAGF